MTKLKTLFDKIVSIALSVIVLFSSVSIVMLHSVSAWDGSAASSFASGSGTESSPYVIDTEMQMGYFMNRLNAGITYEGKYIKLNANLDMTGGKWSVDSSTVFAGTFLGNNKTLTMDSNFLGTIAETGKVDWLNLEGSGTLSTSLLCCCNNGTIQNCRVQGNVYRDSYGVAGLLCLINNKTGVVVNSCGFGSVYGSGDDSDCSVGWIGESEGAIESCYVVVTVSGSAPGRYNSLYQGEIVGKGSYENCHSGTQVVKNDASFVSLLNKSSAVPGYIWAVDSSNVNDGYPVIKSCLSAMTNLSNSTDDMFVFHSPTFSVSLSSSETGCTIYYTLDGTDPITSATRKTYSQAFTISDDTVITSVAYKNGSYGLPTCQYLIQLLGSGTSASPYIVSTNKQFYAIRLEPEKIYELSRDLDFTNEPKIYQGENWVSIPLFSGELRGAGHSITGLSSITGGIIDNNRGVIQELRLIDHQLCLSTVDYNPDHFGAIANHNSGTITRCYAGTDPDVIRSTSVQTNYVGGIAGYNGGTISYCSSSGTLKLTSRDNYSWYRLGGIAGYSYGIIQSCYSDMNLYGARTSHDLGSYISGISFGDTVYDSRFDGHYSVNSATISLGVGGGAAHGGRGSSYRIYNGGATLGTTSLNCRVYYTQETDLYSYSGLKESSYPAFDFDMVWMMTSNGPMPQGIMRADGRCMAKYSYTEPTCTATGSAVSYDMLNTSYRKTETLSMVSHSYSETVESCLGIKTFTCTCGDTYTEIIPVKHYVNVGYIENSTSYPYTLSNGKYTSTNKAASSSSDFYIRVQRDCTLTIKYGVSSESSCDWLTIYHNSSQKDRISGEVSEKTTTISLVAGDYIKITYSKDGSIDYGSNNGWFSIIAGEQVQMDSIISNPVTCTNNVACDVCGVVTDHAWDNGVITVQPSHTTEGVKIFACACGVTKSESVAKLAEHEWDGVITTEPTCEEKGIRTFTCPCGETYTEEVNELGHNYASVLTAPTCTEQGYTTYSCSGCGDTYVTNYTEALGHKKQDISTDHFEPTCEEGVICDICSEVIKPAIGHNYYGTITNPTCGAEGYTTYSCENCGHEYRDDLTEPTYMHIYDHACDESCNVCGAHREIEHGYDTVITEPTCTGDGYATHTCNVCGHTYTDDYKEAFGHAFDHACDTECNVCGYERSIMHNYHQVVTEPTCTEQGYTTYSCSVCGDTYVSNYTEALGHKIQFATMTDSNSYIALTNSNEYPFVLNGDVYSSTNKSNNSTSIFMITALMDCKLQIQYKTSTETNYDKLIITHNSTVEVTVSGIDATWKTITFDLTQGDTVYIQYSKDVSVSNGDDAVYFQLIMQTMSTDDCDPTCEESVICDVCNEVVKPAIGHNYYGIITNPTCGTEGYTTYSCENCGHAYTDDYKEAFGHSFDHACDTECNVCGDERSITHNYHQVVTEPTCTQQGYTTYSCSVCGDTYASNYTEALGHKKQVVSLTNSTTTPFVLNGDIYSSTNNSANSTSIFILTALMDYELEIQYKTSTEAGYDKLTITQNSTVKVTASGTDAIWKTIILDLKQGDKVYIKYSKDGSVNTGNDTIYFKLATQTVLADHCEPTCEESVICDVCNEVVKPATGHNYNGSVTNPTCGTGGYTTYSCENCSNEYTGDFTEPTYMHTYEHACDTSCNICGENRVIQHEYETEVIIPTCTEDGCTTHICTVCGNTYFSDEIPALGHEYTYVVKEAICIEEGYTTYTCENCGHTYVDNYTDATGVHIYENGICTECNSYLESDHDYTDSLDKTWMIYHQGAGRITITFSAETFVEDGWDFIYIYDANDDEIGKYTGAQLASQSIIISGDTAKIRLQTDRMGTAYGFAVTDISVAYNIGDVNHDGDINGLDIMIINRYLVEWEGYSADMYDMNAADVNADGVVNGKDVIRLMQYVAGWDVVLG